jgi:hypothetical protein
MKIVVMLIVSSVTKCYTEHASVALALVHRKKCIQSQMQTHTNVNKNTNAGTNANTQMQTHTNTQKQTHVHMQTQMSTQMQMHTHGCARNTYTHMCMHARGMEKDTLHFAAPNTLEQRN